MLDYPGEDMVITERAALVAWRLAHGEVMTTDAVAEMVGVCQSTAYRMMAKLARVLPVTLVDGYWEAVFLQESRSLRNRPESPLHQRGE